MSFHQHPGGVIQRSAGPASFGFVYAVGRLTTRFPEPDIEKALLEAMGKWKLDVEATRPTENSLAELSEMISTVAIGLQDFEQFEQLAGIAMFQRQESDLGSEAPEDTSAETASDWGSENGGWADEETADDGADSESSADEGGWGAET